jgi:hypothetical protein
LPPLEEDVAATSKRHRARVTQTVGEQVENHSATAARHLHTIHDLSVATRALARGDREQKPEDVEAEVARTLGRGLTPGERVMVRQMYARGKKPAEIAAALRE